MEINPQVTKFMTSNKAQGRVLELNQRYKDELRLIHDATVLIATHGTEPVRLTTVKRWLKQLPGNPHKLSDTETNAFVHTDMKQLSAKGLINAKHGGKHAVLYIDPKAVTEVLAAAKSKDQREVYRKNLERFTTLPKRVGYTH